MVHMLLLHVPGYFEFLLIMGRVIRSAPPKLASSTTVITTMECNDEGISCLETAVGGHVSSSFTSTNLVNLDHLQLHL